ncbi:MAG: glycosyltransferase family protein [Gemmobacter sp.]
MRAMIVVTHLLGTGHLARARVLAAAFRDAGHRVLLVSGGMPVAHLAAGGAGAAEWLQLPPVAAEGADFARLMRPDGMPVDAAWLGARTAMLLAALRDFAPDCLITELYPFGRRSLRAEFDALLAAASAQAPRPCILASVRDILAPPSKPERAAQTEAILAAHYDAVLVHADPAETPLDVSWPVTEWLRPRLRYTGYIAPAAPAAPTGADQGAVVVSAGGGDVGAALFEAALQAAADGPARRWHLLVGGGRAAAECDRLRALAARLPGLAHRAVIEPARADFRALLLGAAASVSLCGYNTALDLLVTGTPGVFVPFDAGRETEQRMRAEALARRPQFAVVNAAELGPGTLNAALDRVLAAGRFTPDLRMLNGAAQSVAIAESLVDAR